MISPVADFVIVLLAILFSFGGFIAFLAIKLYKRIPQRIYSIVEMTIIGGIMLGIIGMFQPESPDYFKPGFLLLFASTLAYIVWSHIIPKQEDDLQPQPSVFDQER